MMSVAMLSSEFDMKEEEQQLNNRPLQAENYTDEEHPVLDDDNEDNSKSQMDIWSAIQQQKTTTPLPTEPAPYIHPLLRRSSSSMSQSSLEICTESLGSETGSDDFSAFTFSESMAEIIPDTESNKLNFVGSTIEEETLLPISRPEERAKELNSDNYHCSIGRRSPPRSFPPPLPSLCRRDGPCLHMRPHRRDGRLVVEAVAVPSQNYLHSQRHDGRLLLTVVGAPVHNHIQEPKESHPQRNCDQPAEDVENEDRSEDEENEDIDEDNEQSDNVEEDDDENEIEEEEEEVEVVDRGTVVEVKVSTQQQSGSGAEKVHRSSLVINKFVSGTPLNCDTEYHSEYHSVTTKRTIACSTTTAAAAAVAASSVSSMEIVTTESVDNKFCFTSKLSNREELLHNMKRCSELRKPLFIWESRSCIATST